MSLVKGNNSSNNPYVNSSTPATHSHNQNTGADGYLVVMICLGSGSGTVSGIKYGTQNMTLIKISYAQYPSAQKMYIYALDAPSTGTHTVEVSWGTIPYNYVSIGAVSFLGCSNVSQPEFKSINATTATDQILISSNSMIMAQGLGGAFNYDLQLPQGSSRPLLWTNNVSNTSYGAVSTNLTSGYKNCTVVAGYGIAMQMVEIHEAVSITPPTRRRLVLVT